jgi:hypothetical protein
MENPVIVPLTISTALYEHRGEVKLPENDTLAWLDETMEERDSVGGRRGHAC